MDGIKVIENADGKKYSSFFIELVEYEKSHDYERSDAPMRTFNVLGVEIPKLIVPVIMGRNLAIIVEVAAKNFRLKQMGYDANEELIERMNRD